MPDLMDTMQDKLINRFFQKVDNVVWDLMTGKMGVVAADGVYTLSGEGDDAQPELNLFDQFSVPLPAFAQNTPAENIQLGDLIYSNGKIHGWVVAKTGKSFRLLKTDGTRGEWRPPKVATLGMNMDGAMVLRSLMTMVGGSGLGNMQNNLMPLMMMGGGGGAMEDMLPIMLMSQMGMNGITGETATTAAVEAKPAVYARDADGKLCLDEAGDPIVMVPAVSAVAAVPPQANGGMGNMMQTMMMMKMMGGGGKDATGPTNFFDRNDKGNGRLPGGRR